MSELLVEAHPALQGGEDLAVSVDRDLKRTDGVGLVDDRQHVAVIMRARERLSQRDLALRKRCAVEAVRVRVEFAGLVAGFAAVQADDNRE